MIIRCNRKVGQHPKLVAFPVKLRYKLTVRRISSDRKALFKDDKIIAVFFRIPAEIFKKCRNETGIRQDQLSAFLIRNRRKPITLPE